MGRKNNLNQAYQHIANAAKALEQIISSYASEKGVSFYTAAHMSPFLTRAWTLRNILQNAITTFIFAGREVKRGQAPETTHILILLEYADNELRQAIDCLDHCSLRRFGKGWALGLHNVEGELLAFKEDVKRLIRKKERDEK